MRKTFAQELHKQMQADKRIILLTGDLGYGVLDQIRDDFPDRFVNCGAAEQAMMGMACGLAMEGKIPFVWSITTFLLYRPFEVIRTYINHEQLNVKLIGSGRDKDYHIDGFSHDASDAWKLFNGIHQDGILDKIDIFWPNDKEQIPEIVDKMCKSGKPEFLSLRR